MKKIRVIVILGTEKCLRRMRIKTSGQSARWLFRFQIGHRSKVSKLSQIPHFFSAALTFTIILFSHKRFGFSRRTFRTPCGYLEVSY